MRTKPPMLRVAEIAPLLGLSSRRCYQLIALGELPGVRIGGRLRVPRRAFEAWLEERNALAMEAGRVGTGGGQRGSATSVSA